MFLCISLSNSFESLLLTKKVSDFQYAHEVIINMLSFIFDKTSKSSIVSQTMDTFVIFSYISTLKLSLIFRNFSLNLLSKNFDFIDILNEVSVVANASKLIFSSFRIFTA